MTHRHVLAATVLGIGVAGLIAGCSSNGDNKGPLGSLTITLGAKSAVPQLKAAVITIATIEARGDDGTWVPMETGLPADVDLIAIMNAGNVATLPADLLPVGDYDALELRLTQVQLTLTDDTKIAITSHGSGWTVQIPVNFSVGGGRSTIVNLHLRCASSFKFFNGAFEFDPEIDVEGVAHD